MAEAIFPFIIYPPEGQLPFINTARVMKGDTLIALNVPVSVWPVGGTLTDVGLAYDHQGEAPLEYAQILRMANCRLYIDDMRYTVVSIEKNEYVPHVALALREMNSML